MYLLLRGVMLLLRFLDKLLDFVYELKNKRNIKQIPSNVNPLLKISATQLAKRIREKKVSMNERFIRVLKKSLNNRPDFLYDATKKAYRKDCLAIKYSSILLQNICTFQAYKF